jgi:hypothetical protein
LTACGNSEQKVELGEYISHREFSPKLILESGNKYVLFGPPYISFVPRGLYTIENGKIYLDDYDEHVFAIEENYLVFESGIWLEYFVEPGTRFYLSENAVWDDLLEYDLVSVPFEEGEIPMSVGNIEADVIFDGEGIRLENYVFVLCERN